MAHRRCAAGDGGCALKTPPDAAAIQARGDVGGRGTGGVDRGGRRRRRPSPTTGSASFRDEQLIAAVNEAIANNADLRVGAARVEQAMLYAKLAGAKLYPSVDLLARGGGKLSGDSSGLEGARPDRLLGARPVGPRAIRPRGGRGRRRVGCSRLRVRPPVDRGAGGQELVPRDRSRACRRRWRGRRFATASELVQLAEARIARRRRQRRRRVHRARERSGISRDTVRQLELAREQAHAGAGAADRPVSICSDRRWRRNCPASPTPCPSGLPSELLERRPDVVAAERRVAAAFNRIGEAKAARLPTISLTTGVSAISSELFVLKDRDNPIWNAGASLLMPIYKGGALKTQVEIRTAEQKQAIAAYASIGLRAFSEVESALAAEIAAREREQILTQTLADNRRAFEIVQTQFKVGSTDLRFVTQRQLALVRDAVRLIRMQAEQRVQRVNLHLALGGSFETAPAAAPAPRPRRNQVGLAAAPAPSTGSPRASRASRRFPHTSSVTGTRSAVPARSTISVTAKSSCSWISRNWFQS